MVAKTDSQNKNSSIDFNQKSVVEKKIKAFRRASTFSQNQRFGSIIPKLIDELKPHLKNSNDVIPDDSNLEEVLSDYSFQDGTNGKFLK